MANHRVASADLDSHGMHLVPQLCSQVPAGCMNRVAAYPHARKWLRTAGLSLWAAPSSSSCLALIHAGCMDGPSLRAHRSDWRRVCIACAGSPSAAWAERLSRALKRRLAMMRAGAAAGVYTEASVISPTWMAPPVRATTARLTCATSTSGRRNAGPPAERMQPRARAHTRTRGQWYSVPCGAPRAPRGHA